MSIVQLFKGRECGLSMHACMHACIRDPIGRGSLDVLKQLTALALAQIQTTAAAAAGAISSPIRACSLADSHRIAAQRSAPDRSDEACCDSTRRSTRSWAVTPAGPLCKARAAERWHSAAPWHQPHRRLAPAGRCRGVRRPALDLHARHGLQGEGSAQIAVGAKAAP